MVVAATFISTQPHLLALNHIYQHLSLPITSYHYPFSSNQILFQSNPDNPFVYASTPIYRPKHHTRAVVVLPETHTPSIVRSTQTIAALFNFVYDLLIRSTYTFYLHILFIRSTYTFYLYNLLILPIYSIHLHFPPIYTPPPPFALYFLFYLQFNSIYLIYLYLSLSISTHLPYLRILFTYTIHILYTYTSFVLYPCLVSATHLRWYPYSTRPAQKLDHSLGWLRQHEPINFFY